MKAIPRDRQIIIRHNLGTNVALWSEPDNKFVYANVQIDLYDGSWNMKYFENEYLSESEIICWWELEK